MFKKNMSSLQHKSHKHKCYQRENNHNQKEYKVLQKITEKGRT